MAVPDFRVGPRAAAAALLLLTATLGVLAGIALDRTLLAPPPTPVSAPAPDRPPGRRWHEGMRHDESVPGGARHRYAERFARELDLTPEQQARIDSILQSQQERVRALRRESLPRFQEITRETRRAVEAVLTPEQREQIRLRQRRWRDTAREHWRERGAPTPER